MSAEVARSSAAAAAIESALKAEPADDGGVAAARHHHLAIRATEELIKSEDRHHLSPDSSVSPEPPFRCAFPQHIALKHPQKLGALAAGPLAAVAAAAAAAAAAAKNRLEVTPIMVSSSSEVPPLDLAKSGSGLSSTSGSPSRSSPPLSSEGSPSANGFHMNNNRSSGSSNGSVSPDGDEPGLASSSNLLLRTTTEMLRAASGVPVIPAAANSVNNNNIQNLSRNRNGGLEASLPMNLSVKKQAALLNGVHHRAPSSPPPPPSPAAHIVVPAAAAAGVQSPLHHFPSAAVPPMAASPKVFSPGQAVAKLINGNTTMELDTKIPPPLSDDTGSESSSSRKRRKQTHVPDEKKDERYWARRLKNNEAAKRSRDMRIKREKLVFDENMRLENSLNQARSDAERLATENKELHLKMDIIMEENNRLKTLLLSYQSREEMARRLSSESEGAPVAAVVAPAPSVPHPSPAAAVTALSVGGPKKLLQLRGQEELKKLGELRRPFPFPDGGAAN